MDKEFAFNVLDTGGMDLISGLRRSPGKGNGLPTPVFLPGESMDRGARQAIVQRVTKSWT